MLSNLPNKVGVNETCSQLSFAVRWVRPLNVIRQINHTPCDSASLTIAHGLLKAPARLERQPASPWIDGMAQGGCWMSGGACGGACAAPCETQ